MMSNDTINTTPTYDRTWLFHKANARFDAVTEYATGYIEDKINISASLGPDYTQCE